ncbi:MAG: single-stranded-DNA-specific exonuclease RecJ [Gammaproteobacteria bacterium]|nr:single-stranded-DNA-specific exonuclease RecJ [Gammaproteobacteria bacterium]
MLTTIKRRPDVAISEDINELPLILQRIYAQRGISNEEEINHSLTKALPPGKLLNVETGVELIYHCMESDQHILIVGDFDADGATSTALFVRVLKSFGYLNISYLVPNRFEFGYGLTPEIVEVAAESNPALIITVDNGISSIEGVAAAKAKGIDVLITDHHLPGRELPKADVIINPNQNGDSFPSKHLAGVGVVFYVLSALRALLREKNWFDEKQLAEPNLARFLDIVAVGTIADVAKLDYNNRILVDQGLRRIRADKCCAGIRALLTVAGKKLFRVSSTDLGFVVGPRLNAAGRLEDMSLGIECLLTDDESRALELAKQLNDLNEERKQIEQEMQKQALEVLKSNKFENVDAHQFGIVLYDADWHQGVIGIVAARLKEKFHRPVIVFAQSAETELKGSARSIPGLHIRDAIDLLATRHPELVNTFGGHAMAAGMSIPKEKFEEFSAVFDQIIEELVTPDQLEAILLSDGELNENELSLDIAELLFRAGPWGQGFPEPIFDGVFNVNDHRIVGKHHLKLNLTPSGGQQKIDAIAFNIEKHLWRDDSREVRIAYQLSINEFRGMRSAQLIIQHLESI